VIRGRPRIGETVMTPAERQRRRGAKLAATINPTQVLADLDRTYHLATWHNFFALRCDFATEQSTYIASVFCLRVAHFFTPLAAHNRLRQDEIITHIVEKLPS